MHGSCFSCGLVRTVVALVLVAPLLAGAPVRADASAARTAVTAEQELLALLPYRLAGNAVPAGFALLQQTAVPNDALAFSYPPDERRDALDYLEQSGRITGLQQQFRLPNGAPPAIRLTAALYDSATDAAQAVQITGLPAGSTGVSPLTVPAIGDASRALIGSTASGGAAEAVIAWSRGRLYFAVDARGDEEDAGAAAQVFEGAANRLAGDQRAALPPAPVNQSTGEQARLSLAVQLEVRQLPANAAPAGLSFGGGYIWSNEQLVLDSASPDAMERQLAGDWRRTTAEVEYFQAEDGSGSVLSSVYAGFAAASGASSALLAKPLGTAGGAAVVALDIELQLGDESTAYQSVLVWPGQQLRLSYTVLWRRGNVLLGISVNVPSGGPSPDYLASVAQALDDAYEANPL